MHIELATSLAALPASISPEIVTATRNLFTPLVLPLGDVQVTRDIVYGDDARQKLDLFQPPRGERMPVVAYLPGGGFVAGDKNVDGTFLGNVGGYFARNGMLGVVANYRLAPTHTWPAGAEDVGHVIAWIQANAAKYGGDPARIFLWGHSAGATHVASYLFDASLRRGDGGVAAAILTSGLYRVTKEHTLAPNLRAYFGADESQLAARSPITHVRQSKVPLFLLLAEYDPPFLAAPTLELAAAICERDGRCPRLTWLEAHNHFSPAFCVGTRDDDVGPQVLAFIRAFR
jgi:triacylglycerol lipase